MPKMYTCHSDPRIATGKPVPHRFLSATTRDSSVTVITLSQTNLPFRPHRSFSLSLSLSCFFQPIIEGELHFRLSGSLRAVVVVVVALHCLFHGRKEVEMGKFMRKRKEMGEVAVVEVPPVGGARTRARALAELRKRSGAVVSGELQVSYLELRSRRLVKYGPPKEKPGEFGSRVVGQESPAANSGAGDEDARVSMCSGTGSSEEEVRAARSAGVSDPEVEASPGECSAEHECIESVREKCPPTDLRAESEALELTTSSVFNDSVNYRRKTSQVGSRMTPPSSEIEEFFAAFEKEVQRRFAEKYNYDVVKDIPLAGRYEWVKVTP